MSKNAIYYLLSPLMLATVKIASMPTVWLRNFLWSTHGCAAFLGGVVGEMEPSTNEIMILLNGIPG
jgi:hypothetical protein